MSEEIIPDPSNETEDDEKFELSPEEATDLGGKPSVINRKRILIAITVFFLVLVCGGLLIKTINKNNKKNSDDKDLYAANSSQSDFLDALQNRALRNMSETSSAPEIPTLDSESKTANDDDDEPLLPRASFVSRNSDTPNQLQQTPPPSGGSQPQQQPSAPSHNSQQQPTHFKSSLVPPVEGRLFAMQTQTAQPTSSANSSAASRSAAEEYFASVAAAGKNASNPYGSNISDYDAQNGQQNKSAFYGSSDNGGQNGGFGFFISDNSLWTGTIIPAVLETAINTDLPGNVLARVTQNIYDSKTGLNLLIPQGTLLLARYNSSISYAQHRVQIVWDTMIRPDGFQIDFGGANGVDKEGMSGSAAKYHENWFEYIKAAGIITLFSIANAKMAETAAELATDETAAAVASANSSFVNQVGGNFVGRAMNIQPTLTVDNGAQVNVMLNRTLFLPPVPNYPTTKKYILE